MNAEPVVKLIEEMIDLKIQQYAQSNLKDNPEIARILEEKRVTDRRRLEQIRAELNRLLGACTEARNLSRRLIRIRGQIALNTA